MVECTFCYSSDKLNYLFTECSHLVCLECAGQKWDQKYSLRCCSKTTYLEEETCHALTRLAHIPNSPYAINSPQLQQMEKEKENLEHSDEISHSRLIGPQSPQNKLEQSYCQKVRLEESLIVRAIDLKPAMNSEDRPPVTPEDRQKEESLHLMEEMLREEVSKVKCEYDAYHKEFEQKEQLVLKELYDAYSDHLNAMQTSCSHSDVLQLRDKLQRWTQQSQPVRRVERVERDEVRQDKILDKLDYNQQKMKEKLHKHY